MLFRSYHDLQEQRDQLQALRQAAFEPEGESLGTGLSADRRRSLCVREFRKLGFSVSYPTLVSTQASIQATVILGLGPLPELPALSSVEQQPSPGPGACAPRPAGPGQYALLLQTCTKCIQSGQ